LILFLKSFYKDGLQKYHTVKEGEDEGRRQTRRQRERDTEGRSTVDAGYSQNCIRKENVMQTSRVELSQQVRTIDSAYYTILLYVTLNITAQYVCMYILIHYSAALVLAFNSYWNLVARKEGEG
jgi:hypothetical protein